MKKQVIASLFGLALFGAPLASAAKSTEESYLASYSGRSGIPVPVSVVSPKVPFGHAGTVVEVTFVVDESGNPVGLETPATVDADLAREVVAAVAQWKFSPARSVEGERVATKVVLPVHIKKSSGGWFVAGR
jgi:TonB family protein